MTVEITSKTVAVKGDYGTIYDEFYRRGWTDGLPIVPPTQDRIEKMLEATDLKPDHVLGELPPRGADLTVEKLAINAVMAGCLPEYFPLVLTIAEVILLPEFAIFSISTTTSPVTECMLVNGPVRHELDINCRFGYLGPGWRANATIGRAIKLTERNVGGTIPGSVSKSTNGQPGRYGTLLFGELEEGSPWSPFHTSRGFEPADSTVTVHPAVSVCNIANIDARTSEGLLTVIANSINYVGTNTLSHGGTRIQPTLIVLCPDHARLIAKSGMSREDVQQWLLEHARRRITDWHPEFHDMLRERGIYRDGYLYMHERPDQFLLAVAGGDGGIQTTFFPNFLDISRTITRRVRAKGQGMAG